MPGEEHPTSGRLCANGLIYVKDVPKKNMYIHSRLSILTISSAGVVIHPTIL